MTETTRPIQDLARIRAILEQTTTAMSLSGLAGILSGVYGLVSTVIISQTLHSIVLSEIVLSQLADSREGKSVVIITLLAALGLALLSSLWLTSRRAAKRGVSLREPANRLFLLHLFIPLGGAGLFALGLIIHNLWSVLFPFLCLGFGLAILNAGRFVPYGTLWLGVWGIALGLVGMFLPEYGLLCWGILFGPTLWAYGSLFYLRHER